MRTAITTVINKYIKSASARAVALELVMTVRAMERIMTEPMSEELRRDALRALTVMLLDMPANTFWRDNGNYLLPIVASSVNAWIDSTLHAEKAVRATDEPTEEEIRHSVRFHALRATTIEIALAVLYCEQGAGPLREVSYDMREELLRVLK